MMPPIFLLGFMASGKSTLARAIARRTGRRFIDLDRYIENRFHSSIPDIFASRGEEAFRSLEQAMLREVADMEDVVVALGGGAPCAAGTMEYLNARGTTLLLRASRERTLVRLMRHPERRPLIARLADCAAVERYIEAEQARREPFYSQAQFTLDSDALESHPQIESTLKALEALAPGLLDPICNQSKPTHHTL